MREYRFLRVLFLIALASAGCARGFKVTRYSTNESLFQAALEQLGKKKWDHAVVAFEKLTFELPARDTLLPLSQWYLAQAYMGRKEYLLAAQAFNRFAESFAADSLADNALFEAARSYQRMWRKPALDPNYGLQALAAYSGLNDLYPDSELRDETTKQIGALNEWFASKDYDSGMYYYRRRAFDSAIIYFKDVVKKFPATAKSKEAYLRLAELYDLIRYREDKKDVCTTLREKYPADKEVALACGSPEASIGETPKPKQPTTPPDLR